MAFLSPHSGFRLLAAIVFPGTASGRNTAVPPSLVWLLHALLWVGLSIALGQLSGSTGTERWLRSPWPMLHRVWLPLLAVLIYALGWLSVCLWYALSPVPTDSYPEVDAAWNEVVRHLKKVSPCAAELPRFLILGASAPDLRPLLESTGASCVAARTAVPLQAFAHPEAILFLWGEQNPTAYSARLHHLCTLLQGDYPGQHALQGVILTVPTRALHSDVEMHHAVARCQAELRVIRQATGLECPVHVVVGDLDGVPDSAAQGWFQRFPLMPDCEPEEMAEALERGINRLCLEKLPRVVRRQMRLDASPAAAGALTETLRDNIRQYQFLACVQAWRERLCRLLVEAISNDYGEPGLLAGCYFLPASAAPMQESPVMQALVTDLLAHQQATIWTPETWTERNRESEITRKGYRLLLAGWLSALAIAGWFLAYRP